ncbi:MAG: hypothetical protein ACOX3T_08365 [Bdellovibrionota bacterium]
MSNSRKFILISVLIYILIIVVFFILKNLSPFDTSITISILQYALAFLLLIFLNSSYIKKKEIFSKFALRLITVVLCVFLLTEFYFTNFIDTKIVQARFLNDSFEIKSRVLREAINQRISDSTLRVKRYPFFIEKNNISDWLKKNGKEILIWGDDKFVNLSFRKKNNFSLGLLNIDYQNSDLIIIEDVQNVRIPYEPVKATVAYITNILYKLKNDNFKLKLVGKQKFKWQNNSHTAYPLLLLGNHYLKDYIKSNNKYYLRHAIKHYEKALSFIRVKDNEQIYFALVNNLMVSYYVKYLNTAKIKHKKTANALFKKNFFIDQNIKSNIPIDMRLIFIENKLLINSL